MSSPRPFLLSVTLVILLAGTAALGWIVSRQADEIRRLSDPSRGTSAASAAPDPLPATSTAAVPGRVAEVRRVAIAGAPTLALVQRCLDGEIRYGTPGPGTNGAGEPFCLGRTQLVMQDNGREYPIDERTVTTAADAPLLGGELLHDASPTSNLALVSYDVAACLGTGGCDADWHAERTVFTYSLATHQSRRLDRYPGAGAITAWNPTFTKAIFLQPSCGLDGCDERPLAGYDLTEDRADKALTTEGASRPAGDAWPRDTNGNLLESWGTIEWTGQSTFRAQILRPDGTSRWITGRF